MKTRFSKIFSAVPAVAAAAACAAAAFSGCESADAYAISVKPGDSTVSSASPRVSLAASGWSDYQWALSDTSLGYLSSSRGGSVVYTARSGTFAGGRQTITVTAVGSGTSGGSSTNSASGYTAQAIVTHADETVAETGESGGGEAETPASPTASGTASSTEAPAAAQTPALSLSIGASPAAVTGTNSVVWLTASAGTATGVSYEWGTNIGSLSRTTGDTTMFSPPADAENGQVATVTCTAKKSGYETATATKSIPFKLSN